MTDRKPTIPWNNKYIPWKNDWICPACKNCNTGKDRNCTECGTQIPSDIWLNLIKPKENQRIYCHRCGKRKGKKEKDKDLLSSHICEKH